MQAVLVHNGSPAQREWAASFASLCDQARSLGCDVVIVDASQVRAEATRKALVDAIERVANGEPYLCMPPDRRLVYGSALRAIANAMVAQTSLARAVQAPQPQPQPPLAPAYGQVQLPPPPAASNHADGRPAHLDRVPQPIVAQAHAQGQTPEVDPRIQAYLDERRLQQSDPSDYVSVPHITA